MPKQPLLIYLEPDERKIIERAAKRGKVSLSRTIVRAAMKNLKKK